MAAPAAPGSVLYWGAFRKSLLQHPVRLKKLIKYAASPLGLAEGQRDCYPLSSRFFVLLCGILSFLKEIHPLQAHSRLWLWQNWELKKESPSAPTADLTTVTLEGALCPKGKDGPTWEAARSVPLAVRDCVCRNALFSHG